MKLKLLLFILLFPLVSFAASTNKIDNLWVPTSARFGFGTPVAGEVLTATDSAGFMTWSPIAFSAGDVFTTSNNTFIATTTQRINGQLNTSNLTVFSGAMISTNGSPQTNSFSYSTFRANNAATGRIISFLKQSDGSFLAHIRESGTGIDINDGVRNFSINSSGFIFSGGNVVMNDDLQVVDNVNFGGLASNTATFGGQTITAGNGLNFNSGVLWIPANVSQNITNGSSTAITNLFFLPRGSTSNFVWTSINTATGEGRWEAKSAGGGGDVFTTSNNTFVDGTTNTFNGQTTTSNLLVRSMVTVGTNGNPVSGIFFTNYTFTVPGISQFTAFSTNVTFTGVVPDKTSYAAMLGTGTTNLYVYSFDTISANTMRISIFNPITTFISSHTETIGATAFVSP